jgi:hypothetical protein
MKAEVPVRFIPYSARAFVAAALVVLGATAAAAQSTVTSTDVQRLQDALADASRDVAQVQTRDGALAKDLQSELDSARDDVTYLKVKVRRNEPIERSEYTDLRDRIASIRNRARGENNSAAQPSPGAATDPIERERDTRSDRRASRTQDANEIPVGTEFDVRLQQPLTSRTGQVEDRFEATTMIDLRDERGRVLVPAGSVMRGVVSSVHPATRMERKGSMTVAFDRATINGHAYPIRATVSQAIESEGIAGEKEKIGIGAGAGAILGAILGGAKGALAGILIGGGGTIAATEGKDVELPSGTVLRVRMDAPLTINR